MGVSVVLLAATATAAAGPFVNIHRFDGNSRAGAEMTYVDFDGNNDSTLLRFDLHGQYIDPGTHLGGYLQLPIGYVTGENAAGESSSDTALGNIEIGGIYIPQLQSQTMALVLHGGITLPTAPDDGSALVGTFAGLLRVHDLYQTLPKGTTIRLGASPMFYSGNVYGRIDIGVDINIDNADNEKADPAVHFNVGGGVWATPEIALTLEVSSLTVIDDQDNDDDNLVNGTLGMRYNAGSVAPYVGITVPLDDDISDIINLGLTIGIDAKI